METANRRYTTISIPQPLYEDIKRAIEGTGFRSPTEYLVYVTRLSLQSALARGDAAPAPVNPFASTTTPGMPRAVPPYR